jgi:rhodanese-related sulfurtransferase
VCPWLEWLLDLAREHCRPGTSQLDGHVILLCDEGYQPSLAAETLHQLGFARATDVEGGFQA